MKLVLTVLGCFLGGALAMAENAPAPTFTKKPVVTKTGAGATVKFAVDRETDVAVFIEDANGKVVRHLVAGMLGKNPPPPLKAGSLEQSVEYRTGLMKNPVWSVGAQWVWQGFGLAANRTESSGDPTCSCYTSRFGLDEYGRLFVPDVFRFCVTALDSAGNEIHRFGRYGNVDSAGPNSLLPEPKIALAAPNAVAVGRDKVYIADRKNGRIAVVRLTCAVEETCEVK